MIIVHSGLKVRAVLDQKSGQPLLDGKNPGPQEEIKFWSELTSNLQCIYDQERMSISGM